MNPAFRRIRWHLLWTSLLALLLSGGMFYLSEWRYAASDDECSWFVEPVDVLEKGQKVRHRRVVIKEILPGGVAEEAGLLEGDELKEIAGRKVSADRLQDAQRFINELPEGRIILYKVVRAVPTEEEEGPGRIVQKELLLPIRVTKPFDYSTLALFVTGLVAWSLGTLVVISAPQRKSARQFYYMGLLTLLMILPAGGNVGNLPQSLNILLRVLASAVVILAPPFWLHFSLSFPYVYDGRFVRRIMTPVYALFALLILVNLVNALAGALAPAEFAVQIRGLIQRQGWFTWTGPMLLLGSVLGGAAFFWVGTFKVCDRRRRALLPAMVILSVVLLDLVAYVVARNLAPAGSLTFTRLRWVFFLPLPLLPLAFAYAILRHGVLDVRRALLRWLSYFLVTGLTVGCYLGALSWAFAQGFSNLPPAWAGALLGLMALPIGWFLRWILHRLRRLFRRDLATVRDLILGHLRESRRRLSEEALLTGLRDAIREAYTPQVLHLLPLEELTVQLPEVILEASEDSPTDTVLPSRPLKLPASVLRHARENRELVLGLGPEEAEWIGDADPALRAHVDALEVQVMVLLPVHEAIHSVLLLGGKYAELDYGREDRELLREVAMAAGILLETAQLHRKSLDQGRIEQEMRTARTIQENLITTHAPDMPGFQAALRLEPALETGGDLLWVKRRPSGRWIAAVGDVSGKGLAAALYMSQAMALLKFATQSVDLDFESILPCLDRTLRNLMGARDFITLSLLEWEESGRYRLIRAGHPPALLVRGPLPADVRELAPAGLGLGLRPEHNSGWEVHEAELQPGEWLVLYSDGLTEAMDQSGQVYGLDRLRAQIQRLWGTGSVRAACESVFTDVGAFEAQNRDDRTLLILGRNR